MKRRGAPPRADDPISPPGAFPVSIDHSAKAAVAEPLASPIENEIPAYRAILRGAVFALMFGLLAILSFASLYFLVFAALAVLVGWRADRKIQRYPDTFTGRGLAQTGFGLGLVFGLTAASIVLVQGVLQTAEAKRFARTYEGVLQNKSFNEAVWYMQPAVARESRTPDELAKEMKGSGSSAMAFDETTGPLKNLKKAIDEDQCTVHYDGIETTGEDGLSIYAAVRYEIHAAKPKNPEDAERYALVSAKAAKTEKGKYEWYVQDIKFPYKAGTYVAPPKPVDDGHGHAPGAHH
jgi:hypothetical protein